MNYQIINPADLGAPRGWNNGMLAPPGGRVLFVAGQTAADSAGTVPDISFVEQWDRVLDRIIRVVSEAGGGPESIGRFTIYVTDIAAYRANLRQLGEVYRARMGRHYPAMALVAVTSLVDPRAVVEIEATAIISQQ